MTVYKAIPSMAEFCNSFVTRHCESGLDATTSTTSNNDDETDNRVAGLAVRVSDDTMRPLLLAIQSYITSLMALSAIEASFTRKVSMHY